MKKMKRLAAFLLAMVMMLAMAMPAMAAGSNTITVAGAKTGETYSIYKMLDLTVHKEAEPATGYNGFSYTLNDAWKNFWTTGEGKNYIDTNAIGSKTYVVWKDNMKDAAKMEAFGKAAAKWASDHSIDFEQQKIAGNDGVAFNELENGYYMITSTYGTAVTVGSTPTNGNQTIQEKNLANTTVKNVYEAGERKNASNPSWGEENDAAVGDTITFRSQVSITKNSKNVVYHDTMGAALTWDGVGSVKVYTDDTCNTELAAGNYTVAAGTAPETFTVTFTPEYLNSLTAATTSVYIKYTATLNDNAVVTNPVTNTAKVTWGEGSGSTESTTNTYTRRFELLKYDGTDANKKQLANAKFKLYIEPTGGTALTLAKSTDGTTYRIVDNSENLPTGYTMAEDNKIVTLATGNITIEGVDSDNYYLEETDAPLGYNKLTDRVLVQVGENNTLFTSEIENMSGTVLPTTGGMGTTIFYILGGILVIGAGVLFVTRKRMDGVK